MKEKIDLKEKLQVHNNFDSMVDYFAILKESADTKRERTIIDVIIKNLVAAKMCYTELG